MQTWGKDGLKGLNFCCATLTAGNENDSYLTSRLSSEQSQMVGSRTRYRDHICHLTIDPPEGSVAGERDVVPAQLAAIPMDGRQEINSYVTVKYVVLEMF